MISPGDMSEEERQQLLESFRRPVAEYVRQLTEVDDDTVFKHCASMLFASVYVATAAGMDRASLQRLIEATARSAVQMADECMEDWQKEHGHA